MIGMCPDCGRKVESEDIYIMSFGACWHCVDGAAYPEEGAEECPHCGESGYDGEACEYGCDDEGELDDD